MAEPRSRWTLAPRELDEPHPSRLRPDHPGRAEILAKHAEALRDGTPGYLDPATGLFVLSAAFLAKRGFCCTRGCRHCPYVT
ncbi:hypothetical protein CS0771_27070 [Catellatospora sp. IY07-71]|uniref:DUF5522 domain-containing protein n=1 Tax=Catellatospora sp. IY07-71 TaxID=2728827 RepID=UPI001BB33478|nr:DUF5522 domain-containing protein [Catellatospora sp. IY07-71]BCJ73163.1 hypothetical protein CS0771_27070 [Catellatospora sp. IY07-71]